MRRLTKRDLAISLHNAGRTVEEIATALDTSKTFVSQTIGKAGLLPVNLPPYEPMVPASRVQEARREQMEKDCRAVCEECRDGDNPVVFGQPADLYVSMGIAEDQDWTHLYESGKRRPCDGAAIRRAFEKDNPS